MKKRGISIGISLVLALALILAALGALPALAKSYSISGTVSYTGEAEGDIYVLAFDVKDKRALRGNLNEYKVPDLDIFVAYDKIKHVGDYEIKGLDDGEYYVYAWMDTNDDEDVDFDRCEPTGWHQEDAGWAKVEIDGGDVSGIDITLKEVTPYPEEDLDIEVGRYSGGTLKTIEGKKVLDVWGEPYDRGYAQGYLVGPQIVDAVRFIMIEEFAGSASHYENDVRPWIETHMRWTETDMEELEGIIDGMVDSECDMYLPEADRDVDVVDLMCFNAYGETWQVYFCSAAAVWGPLTENDELKNGVIMFRSMDGENDLRKATVLLALIMVQEPQDSSKNKWASVMFCPGYISTYTGMNEFGIVMEANYAPGKPSPLEEEGYTALGMLIRDVLQTADQIDTDADVMAVHDALSEYTTTGGPVLAGADFMVAAPYYGQEAPVVVYEHDAYGGLIRYPTEDLPIGPYTMCTTNHFRKYEQGEANTARTGDCWRYRALYEALEELEADNYLGHGHNATVTTETFHERICVSSGNSTEYACIFLPNERVMMVAYEDLENKNSNAMSCEFSTYKLDDLFHFQGR